MSEENMMEDLAGAKAENPAEDLQRRYDELEKRYNSARVEEGRVRKMDEELKARDRRIAELEAKLRTDDLTSSLTEEERSCIPDEVLSAATKLVSKGMKDLKEENELRFRELEERKTAERAAYEEDAKRAFVSKINAKYPGFMSSVTAGGDKSEQWNQYNRFNAASINAAIRAKDFDTLSYHIEQFYSSHLGVQVPSGDQDGSAAPDPRASGGGHTGVGSKSGKVYTSEEFLALYDKLEEARNKGDYAEMKRIDAEIKLAPAEGRVN